MFSFRDDNLPNSQQYMEGGGTDGEFDNSRVHVQVENVALEEIASKGTLESVDLSKKEREKLNLLNISPSTRFVRHGSCKKKIEHKKQKDVGEVKPGSADIMTEMGTEGKKVPAKSSLRRNNAFTRSQSRRYNVKTKEAGEVANPRSSEEKRNNSSLTCEANRHGLVLSSDDSDDSDANETSCVPFFRHGSQKRAGLCVDGSRGSRTAWYSHGDLSTLESIENPISSSISESHKKNLGSSDRCMGSIAKDRVNSLKTSVQSLKKTSSLPMRKGYSTTWYPEEISSNTSSSQSVTCIRCHKEENSSVCECQNDTDVKTQGSVSDRTGDMLLAESRNSEESMTKVPQVQVHSRFRPGSSCNPDVGQASRLPCRDSTDLESLSDDNWTISSLSSEEYMADTFLGLKGLLKGARYRGSACSDIAMDTITGINNMTLDASPPGSNRSTYYSANSVCSDDMSGKLNANSDHIPHPGNVHPNLAKARSLSLPRNNLSRPKKNHSENRLSCHSDRSSLYYDAEQSLCKVESGMDVQVENKELNQNTEKMKSCNPRQTVYIVTENVHPEVLDSFSHEDSTTYSSLEESSVLNPYEKTQEHKLPLPNQDSSYCSHDSGSKKGIHDYSDLCPQCRNLHTCTSEQVFTSPERPNSSQSDHQVKQQRCSSDKELPAALLPSYESDSVSAFASFATLERKKSNMCQQSTEDKLRDKGFPLDMCSCNRSGHLPDQGSQQYLCGVDGHVFLGTALCAACDVVKLPNKVNSIEESTTEDETGDDTLSEFEGNSLGSAEESYGGLFDFLDNICTGECFSGKHCQWSVSVGDLLYMKNLEVVCKASQMPGINDSPAGKEETEEVEDSVIHQVELQDKWYIEECSRSMFYTQMVGRDIRKKENITHIDPFDLSVRRELLTEKFTILPGRDDKGAAIALFTARLHFPQQTSHQAVLKALVFQLDSALESIDTQRNGLVFIYDMSHSKYNNFDYELSIKILSMLKGSYPARLKKVLIVTAPLWFRAPFKILRLFVREKLRDRVHTVTLSQLPLHIPMSALPRRTGGNLEINHKAWLRKCLMAVSQDNALHNNVELFFMGTENHNILDMSVTSITSDSSTPPGGDDSNYYISDMDSETSKETISEKHNCEGQEKEVAEEKDISSPEDISSPFSTPGGHSLKRSSDSSPTQIFSGEDPPPLPQRKRRPVSNILVESIHMPEGGGMTVMEFMEHTRRKGRTGLCRDYALIKQEPPSGTFEISKATYNLPKNRYTDVLCFDHSRVRLSCIDGDQTSDYINANYVDGYKQKNAFISSQGPLPRTFPDFWRMIWEERVLVVVMTTRTVERSRLKCGQYWPADEETSAEYGDFVVINNGSNCCESYTVTSLIVQNIRTSETREVTHFQFTSWPDYGVPHSAQAFLQFMFHVRAHQAERVTKMDPAWGGHPLGPPIVVHCSAGIGRTGTFITMDISTRRLADISTIDVHKTVKRIRSQRAFSIQMPDQYVFCHLALIEHAQKEGMVSLINLDGFDGSSSESD